MGHENKYEEEIVCYIIKMCDLMCKVKYLEDGSRLFTAAATAARDQM